MTPDAIIRRHRWLLPICYQTPWDEVWLGVSGPRNGGSPERGHSRHDHSIREPAGGSGQAMHAPSFVGRCGSLATPRASGSGSQVGSHSLWTCVDGCGRLWNREPLFPACVDGCGRLWTRLGDLRIRRLGVRVPPGVPSESPQQQGFRRVGDLRANQKRGLGSHSREPFSI